MARLKVHKTGASMGLTVPTDIAKVIPAESRFACELTEDGILYRILPPEEPKPPQSIPAWCRSTG